ncbi:hypothetical protein BSLG_007691 [Batrachochytrium salamandrivorans]|nr:hypothetical protein BSLG_007691 [Batrachochytrium salamandrivorans]
MRNQDLVLASLLAALPFAAAQGGSFSLLNLNCLKGAVHCAQDNCGSGGGTFLLSNNGVWPAGSTQSVTLTTTTNGRGKMYLDNMSFLVGTSTITICRNTFASVGSTVACPFVVPRDIPSGQIGTVSATWEECREILGSPAFCAFRGASISDPVLVGVTASTSSTTTALASTSTTSIAATTTTTTVVSKTVSSTSRSTLSSPSSTAKETAAATTASNSNNAEPTTHVNTGIIVGAVIGGIVLLLLAGLAFWQYQRRSSGGSVGGSGSSKIQLYTQSRGNGPAPLDPGKAADIRAAAAAAASATGVASGSAYSNAGKLEANADVYNRQSAGQESAGSVASNSNRNNNPLSYFDPTDSAPPMPMSAPPMSMSGPSQPLHQQYYPSYSQPYPPQTFTALEGSAPVGYYQQAPYPHPPSHMPVYYAPQYDQPYDQQYSQSQYDQPLDLHYQQPYSPQGYLPHPGFGAPSLPLPPPPPAATATAAATASMQQQYAQNYPPQA